MPQIADVEGTSIVVFVPLSTKKVFGASRESDKREKGVRPGKGPPDISICSLIVAWVLRSSKTGAADEDQAFDEDRVLQGHCSRLMLGTLLVCGGNISLFRVRQGPSQVDHRSFDGDRYCVSMVALACAHCLIQSCKLVFFGIETFAQRLLPRLANSPRTPTVQQPHQ